MMPLRNSLSRALSRDHGGRSSVGACRIGGWRIDPDHVVREHACLRFAADLSARFGLRGAMAPTTEHRAYYDALPDAPLTAGGRRSGRDRRRRARAVRVITLARASGSCAGRDGGARAAARRGHAPDRFSGHRAAQTCEGCAWMYRGGRGPAVSRCRQTAAAAVRVLAPSRPRARARAGSRPSIATPAARAAARPIIR